MLIRLFAFILFGSISVTLSAEETFAVPRGAEKVFRQCCLECHDANSAEGDVRLNSLSEMGQDARLALLNKVQEQLHLKQMPPKDAPQPTDADRKQLVEWVAQELHKHNASQWEIKLQRPDFGNYVDHEQLFSGEFAQLPGFTYDRRWLISEYIFNAKFQRLLQIKSQSRQKEKNISVAGGAKFDKLRLNNPFLLPTRSGVRYYANTDLTGGHLSSMLTNAQQSSEYITNYLVKRNPKYLSAISEMMAKEDQHVATMTARRELLNSFIDKLCQEYYGAQNEVLLPKFAPVKLNDVKDAANADDFKKAPTHVALNMLKELQADTTVYQFLLTPEHAKKPDDEFRGLCEKTWFYWGDHERKIQGRMAILRDYMPELRDHVLKSGGKIKPLTYKPLSPAEMETVKTAVMRNRQPGDHYTAIVEKCLADWEQSFKREVQAAGPPPEALLAKLVEQLFDQILERTPTAEEANEYLELSKSYVHTLGKLKAIQKLIQTLILSSEFVYRPEFGIGVADEHGRRMLAPRDASYAIAYALTDQSPDEELALAAQSCKLSTREDYQREVTRILKKRDVYYVIDPMLADMNYQDNTTNMAIRKLRFFREFFGYPTAITIFKDEKRFGGDRLADAMARLLNEADRVVEHILERDEYVFEELLTTDKFFIYHDGDNERMQAASDRLKRIYTYFKDLDWKNFKDKDLLTHRDFLKEVKMRSVDPDNLAARNRQGTTLQLFKMSMTTITARLNKGQREAAPFDLYRGYGYDFMNAYNVARFYDIPLDNWDYRTVQPAPVSTRKGLLTHPIWLITHAKNTENDPVIRGKWVREKLLAGTIPDVPITVDASIPEDHDKTLRTRLASATETTYCWKCHERMNPLGYAFECYDDFGRFRLKESLEYPDKIVKKSSDKAELLNDTRDIYETQPVNATGHLSGTGEPALDGEVHNAIDLMERLGKSRKVRQSIIRHAFRYFMGRNETLSDSKALIDAEQAYVKNNGSFDAVIISLLTSDSFIYRKTLLEE